MDQPCDPKRESLADDESEEGGADRLAASVVALQTYVRGKQARARVQSLQGSAWRTAAVLEAERMETRARERLSAVASDASSPSAGTSKGTTGPAKSRSKSARGGRRIFSSGIMVHTNAAAVMLARRNRGEELTLRDRLFLLLNEPETSLLAKLVARFMWVLVLLNSLCEVGQSISWVTNYSGSASWYYASFSLECIFTIEGALRICTYTPVLHAWHDPYVVLDCVTALPFWVRMATCHESLQPDTYLETAQNLGCRRISIRIFEALASFRILKLCRYYAGAALLYQAVRQSVVQLLVPLFMLVTIVYCFACVLYELEWDQDIDRCAQHWRQRGVSFDFMYERPEGVTWDCSVCASPPAVNGTSSAEVQSFMCQTCLGYPTGHAECAGVPWGQRFEDIPRAIWYMFVTVTTVGYGDTVPDTWRGKLFASFAIICGIVFIAMPLTIVGNNFTEVWQSRELRKLQVMVRQMLIENGVGPDEVMVAFRKFDRNGDGQVDEQEFVYLAKQVLNLKLSKVALHRLWRSIDVDQDGSIEFEEFAAVCFGKDIVTDGHHRRELDEIASKRVSARESAPLPPPPATEALQKRMLEALDANTSLVRSLIDRVEAVEGALQHAQRALGAEERGSAGGAGRGRPAGPVSGLRPSAAGPKKAVGGVGGASGGKASVSPSRRELREEQRASATHCKDAPGRERSIGATSTDPRNCSVQAAPTQLRPPPPPPTAQQQAALLASLSESRTPSPRDSTGRLAQSSDLAQSRAIEASELQGLGTPDSSPAACDSALASSGPSRPDRRGQSPTDRPRRRRKQHGQAQPGHGGSSRAQRRGATDRAPRRDAAWSPEREREGSALTLDALLDC